MEDITPGDLVTVDAGGPKRDGIVFDTPSHTKVVVALVDPQRGPIFRTVHPDTLAAREQEGPDDRAINLLMKRTPSPVHGASRGAAGGGHGRAGHSRGAMHRTTGK